jgi:hypothetical protein
VKTDPEIAPLPSHISFKERSNSCSRSPKTRTPHIIEDTARQVINKVLRREDAD